MFQPSVQFSLFPLTWGIGQNSSGEDENLVTVYTNDLQMCLISHPMNIKIFEYAPLLKILLINYIHA